MTTRCHSVNRMETFCKRLLYWRNSLTEKDLVELRRLLRASEPLLCPTRDDYWRRTWAYWATGQCEKALVALDRWVGWGS